MFHIPTIEDVREVVAARWDPVAPARPGLAASNARLALRNQLLKAHGENVAENALTPVVRRGAAAAHKRPDSPAGALLMRTSEPRFVQPTQTDPHDELEQRQLMSEVVRRARATVYRRASTQGRRHALRYMLWRPLLMLREARSGVAQYGGIVAARFGVSVPMQFVHLCILRVRYGIEPDSYYRFRLFLPERRAQAWAYLLQRHQLDVLYRPLRRQGSTGFLTLHHKDRFAAWCEANDLPTVPILATFRHDRIDRRFERLPPVDLFSKPLGGGYGAGVCRWRYEPASDGSDRWHDDAGVIASEPVDAEGLIAALTREAEQQAQMLQPRMTNHPAVADLSGGALCTARVVTLRTGSGVQVLLACYRMSVGASAADNFDAGGVAAAVDLETGRLGQALQKHPRECVVVADRHPGTDAQIAGRVLVQWPAVVELAIRAHECLPDLPIVGWDIAITPLGPMLIEGNSGPGTVLSQMPSGVPLGRRTAYVRAVLAVTS